VIVEYKNKKGESRKWVLQAQVIGALRRLSYKTPMRRIALAKARVARGKYKCESCGKIGGPKTIAVDHVHPVIEITGFKDWDTFIERLFCEVSGLQILCKDPCHNAKTKAENKARRLSKKEKK
jgi:5-methylcytosine-specific restriction endonuclease McrA